MSVTMKTKYDVVTVGGGDGDLVLDDDGAGDDVALGYDMATPMPVLKRKKEGTKNQKQWKLKKEKSSYTH